MFSATTHMLGNKMAADDSIFYLLWVFLILNFIFFLYMLHCSAEPTANLMPTNDIIGRRYSLNVVHFFYSRVVQRAAGSALTEENLQQEQATKTSPSKAAADNQKPTHHAHATTATSSECRGALFSFHFSAGYLLLFYEVWWLGWL
jgi:hypothetical protein